MKISDYLDSPPQLLQFIGSAQRLVIRTHTHPRVSLVAPLIGDDFVAGLDETSTQWVCIRQNRIATLECQRDSGDLPLVRWRQISLEHFLAEQSFPLRIQLASEIRAVRAVAAGWLVLLDGTFIPAQSIEQLMLLEAPDAALHEVLS